MQLSLLVLGLVAIATMATALPFQLSNTLGSNMVLQRAPASAILFGFGNPGTYVTTTLTNNTSMQSSKYTTLVDATGTWRQALPPMPAGGPFSFNFDSSDGGSASLSNVLFGEVFLCGGQSNCQMTMNMCNNASAEIASANNYPNIRVFTVGQGTASNTPLQQLGSIAQKWSISTSSSIGGPSWSYFSGLCWLFGKGIYDSLGGNVPVGLISNNWGGTSIQQWCSNAALTKCGMSGSGNLYNAMINPYLQGPMALKGMIWYQGESNVGQAAYYDCQFPIMINDWRASFKNPNMYFGFVQITGYNYGTDQTPAYLREAQLSALQLPNVGLATGVDVGLAFDIHPTDKTTLANRLLNSAYALIYGQPVQWLPPLYQSSVATVTQSTVTVQIFLRPGTIGTGLTTIPPSYATAVQSNQCVTGLDPQSCGWPTIILNSSSGPRLNATLIVASDKQSIYFQAPLGSNPPTSVVYGTSYGSASWPINLVWNSLGQPLVPWSNVTITA